MAEYEGSESDNRSEQYRPQRHQHSEASELIASTPPRTLGGWITGAIGAVAGWIGGETYIDAKMYDFKAEVKNLVRNDILNRKNGAGAGIDSAGMGGAVDHGGMPMGGFGPGMGSHAIEEAHQYNLSRSGKYPLAKFIMKYGSMPIALASAAVTGVVAMAAYFTLVPKKAGKHHRHDSEPSGGPQATQYDNTQTVPLAEFARAFDKVKDDPEKRKALIEKWESKGMNWEEKAREEKACGCGLRRIGE